MTVTGNSDFAESSPDQTARRTFLAQVIGACLAFLAAVLGIPAVGALVSPALKTDEPTWYPLGALENFTIAAPTSVSITVPQTDGWIQTTAIKNVWVVRTGPDQFTVFNGRCTHLGCAYSWQTPQSEFTCPCHAGVYALDGHVLAGPPPRPLDSMPVRVENGQLETEYQDFRLGTADKEQA